jgi:PAS domain S-box-containing protein
MAGTPVIDDGQANEATSAPDGTLAGAPDLAAHARAHAFENLFDAVVVTDMEGRIVDWNRGSERLYGYSREEALGQPVHILHPPEAGDEILREVLASIEREGRWQGEVGLVRKDGSRGWIESAVVPLYDEAGQQVGALGINRDISARVAAKQELAAAETRFRSLVEYSLVGIHIIHGDRFVYANPRFAEIFGYSTEELIDHVTVPDLIHEADREKVRVNLRRRFEGGLLEPKYSFRGRRKDGQLIHVEVHGTRIDLDGEPAVIGMLQDVTERHVAEQQLRASEERYRLIARASTDVFRDWDLREGTVHWGPSTAPVFHYPASRLGRTPEWWTHRIHPEDRTPALRSLQSALDGGGDSWLHEYRFLRGDGEYAVVLDRACIVRDDSSVAIRMMSSMHDVTERRRGEEAQSFLARASTVLDARLEQEATMVGLARLAVPFIADCCLVDEVRPDGSSVRVAAVHTDPARESWLLHGTPGTEEVPAQALIREVARSAEPALLRGERDAREAFGVGLPTALMTRAGLRSLLVVPLVVRGATAAVMTLGASADRRAYSAMDLEVARSLAARAVQALENARLYREATEAVEARSRLFADVSHEFRTPLMLTLGPLDDLLAGLHGPLAEEQRDPVAGARRNAGRLLDLVNQTMELARLEAGRLPMSPVPFDLRELAGRTTAEFASLAERRGVRLEAVLPEDALPVVADPERLGQVLANLLSNALKYTLEDGEVVVRAEHGPDGTGRVSVRDSGPGIPAEELEHVFDRFHRLGDMEARVPGSGIGLALARQLTEASGGRLTVRSEVGRGSIFTAELPLAPATMAAEREELTGPDLASQSPRPSARGEVAEAPVDDETPAEDVTTVLVVEDNPEVRAHLRFHLDGSYRVLEASDGAQALEHVRSDLPDLVISDVMMPGMDGFALCRAIREDPETDFIPVVLLTALDGAEDRLRGLEQEADAYLTKPIQSDELLARVANLLASRARLKERYAAMAPLRLHSDTVEAESPDRQFLEQVRVAIETNLGDEAYTVERLARDVAHSRSHLYRRLKELLDENPSDLLRRMRLERGAQLLEANAGSVASVAYSVGFKSVSHFSNSFQQAFGVRPSRWPREGSRR